ncbi:MAG: hypothetical protein PHO26_03590 [Dehalococcoidia bacterium]|nr:hypothetical protein [Dehalococcoidia bacterium]MDD5494839.1 hypothetical protein [Dehalococcoidia bacterium]
MKAIPGISTVAAIIIAMLFYGCSPQPAVNTTVEIARNDAIPAAAVKMNPQTDSLPPQLHSPDYENPIPLGSGVNTAGGEDSAFITPDGNTLYFFFTPDVKIPAEKQLIDGVTGIWVSYSNSSSWSPAQRVVLQDKGEVALDGCAFVQGDTFWFGSARRGNFRGVDIWTAKNINGKWADWKNAGQKLNADYEVGELHISPDGREMYFHSPRKGGKGGYDIWKTSLVNGDWQQPVNVEELNTPDNEGWPFIASDGGELWFTRWYKGSPGVFRARRSAGGWSTPELILSQFAAEPSLDNYGNLYFTHHFFKDGKMIEADIYVSRPHK